MGSLLTAVASYLDARSCGGEWLVRIDDLDVYRNRPSASAQILRSLEAHGLICDESPTYQQHNLAHYAGAFTQLQQSQRVFPCVCSRSQLAAADGRYPGICRNLKIDAPNCAWRVLVTNDSIEFCDRLYGHQQQCLESTIGDFVVRRRDGLFAYQLAVVVDDHLSQVNHVVRGHDLLDNTPRQIFLQDLLGYSTPSYLHVPLVLGESGMKLSKQTGAAALDDSKAINNLVSVLGWLGFVVPNDLRCVAPAELLTFAAARWRQHLVDGGVPKSLPATSRK